MTNQKKNATGLGSPHVGSAADHVGGTANMQHDADQKAQAKVATAREDEAALAAWRIGNHANAAAHLQKAERYAAETGDVHLLLRQMIRAEVVSPFIHRRAAIGAMARSKDISKLFEEHASDFFLKEPPRQTEKSNAPPGASNSRHGSTVRRDEIFGRICRLPRLIAALVAVPAIVALNALLPGPSFGTTGDAGVLGRLGAWVEAVLGALLAMFHVVKALSFDPVSRTLSSFTWIGSASGLARSIYDIVTASTAGRNMAFMILTLLVLSVIVAGARIASLHVGRVLPRPNEKVVFEGRRLWYSYHKRLLVAPIAAMTGGLVSQFVEPIFALPFDFIATLGLIALAWLLVPGTRPRLLVSEVPSESRQARVEVLYGVFSVQHVLFPIYELRAAALGPSRWWSPTQDIVLRDLQGKLHLLEGFAGPTGANKLVDDINVLIRRVPPLPFASPAHPIDG